MGRVGKMTAAATSGPAHAPRPASSTPGHQVEPGSPQRPLVPVQARVSTDDEAHQQGGSSPVITGRSGAGVR